MEKNTDVRGKSYGETSYTPRKTEAERLAEEKRNDRKLNVTILMALASGIGICIILAMIRPVLMLVGIIGWAALWAFYNKKVYPVPDSKYQGREL